MRQNGDAFEHAVDSVLSSIPLSELVLSLDPPAPAGGAGGSAPAALQRPRASLR